MAGGRELGRANGHSLMYVDIHWNEILHIIEELLKESIRPYDILNEKDVFEGDSF